MPHLNFMRRHCDPAQGPRDWPLVCSIICFAFGCAVSGGAPAIAQEKPAALAPDDASLVKPFVGETTFLIVKVDPARLALPKAGAWASMSREAKAHFAEISQSLTGSFKQLQTLADNQPIFATVGIPESRTRVSAFCFRRKTSAENAENITAFVRSRLKADAQLQGDYVVVTPQGGRNAPTSKAPDATQAAIKAAFKEVGGYPVQLLVVPPEHVWRTVRELAPELPPQLGGGPSSVLTDGVQWAGIGFDPQRLHLEVVIQSAGDKAAQQFAAYLPTMLRSASEAIQSQATAKLARHLIGQIKPQVEGSQVKIRIDGLAETSGTLSVIASVAQLVEERARRRIHEKRLRSIVTAMQDYYDTYKSLPPMDKYRDENGKHRLSWRVHVLPYLDERALYNQFHLDEAWDSPHNKKLIEKMPDVYASVSLSPAQASSKAGYTTFLAPVGAQTVFGGAKATKFSHITDGTGFTVALLEAAPKNAVPWTAPVDYSFDPKNPLAGVSVGVDGTWLCAFVDGRAEQLRSDIPAESVLNLFRMNEGNPVNFDQLR